MNHCEIKNGTKLIYCAQRLSKKMFRSPIILKRRKNTESVGGWLITKFYPIHFATLLVQLTWTKQSLFVNLPSFQIIRYHILRFFGIKKTESGNVFQQVQLI